MYIQTHANMWHMLYHVCLVWKTAKLSVKNGCNCFYLWKDSTHSIVNYWFGYDNVGCTCQNILYLFTFEDIT